MSAAAGWRGAQYGRGGIVPIPGEPGEFIHKSILADVVKLKKKYRLDITDGYAPTGHDPQGEHPKGLAIDAGPGQGGSWGLVDQLATGPSRSKTGRVNRSGGSATTATPTTAAATISTCHGSAPAAEASATSAAASPAT